MLTVQIGGLVFRGLTDDGFLIEPGGLVGWWGRPQGSGEQTARPGGHGEFDTPLFLGARVVTVTGRVLADPEAMDAECGVLSGLGADGQQMRITVSEGGAATTALGRVVGVQVDRRASHLMPAFQIIIRCANPRKFGEAREFSSPRSYVDAWHYGNFPATPRFTVTGPFTGGYRIRTADSVYEVPSTLASGAVDVVDFNDGTVRRNGSLLVGVGGTRQRFTVPGGASIAWRVEAVSSGTGSAVMVLPDTYV